jgi:GTP-binding protein Era
MRVLGIRNTAKAQTVFIDTPGAPGFDSLLNQYLKREIEAARANVDAILFMTDTRRNVFENDKKLLKELSGSLVFLVINKVDQVPREELLPVIKR